MIVEKLDNILIEKGIYDTDPRMQDELLESLDSLKFIELVVAIEISFEIGISDEYLLLKYFSNKNSIIRVIASSLNENLKTVKDVVEENKCIGCLACVELCPKGKLGIDTSLFPYPTPIINDVCDSCGLCLLECPAKLNY